MLMQVNQNVKVCEVMWPETTLTRRQGPSRAFHLPHPLSLLVTRSRSFYLLFITGTHIILFSHFTPAIIQIFTRSRLVVLPSSHHALQLVSRWASMKSTTFSHPGLKQIKLIISFLKRRGRQREKRHLYFWEL